MNVEVERNAKTKILSWLRDCIRLSQIQETKYYSFGHIRGMYMIAPQVDALDASSKS